MHAKWFPIKQEIVRLLQGQTLDMLAATVVSGKYQLTDFPDAILDNLKLSVAKDRRFFPARARRKKKQVFKHGEVLYRMGQPLEYIYIIRGGSVKTCIGTEEGRVQVIGFHAAGELLGLNALGTSQHNCDVRALGTTSVCEVSLERFEELVSKDPAIQY